MLRIIFEIFSFLKNSANFIYSAMHLRCSSEDKRGPVLEVSPGERGYLKLSMSFYNQVTQTQYYMKCLLLFDFSYELCNCFLVVKI